MISAFGVDHGEVSKAHWNYTDRAGGGDKPLRYPGLGVSSHHEMSARVAHMNHREGKLTKLPKGTKPAGSTDGLKLDLENAKYQRPQSPFNGHVERNPHLKTTMSEALNGVKMTHHIKKRLAEALSK